MKHSRIITLLTDFGTKDPYVGAMKGVILGINPDVVTVDISHDISPQNVAEAAFCMLGYVSYFPRGTIHVCVVDPGVGSNRRAIAIQCPDFFLIGPDNGVFTLAIKRFGYKKAVVLENPKFFRASISKTFHGRDVFAPVAAHLSKGAKIEMLGRAVSDFNLLYFAEPKVKRNKLQGEIIHFDRFGNAITNIDKRTLKKFLGGKNPLIAAKDKRIKGLTASYEEARAKEPCALIDSYGFLEIFVLMTSARELVGLNLGDKVWVKRE